MIRESIWFALEVASIAGCILWYRRAPSRHLIMMIAGIGWMSILGLPALFAELFGISRLSDYADRIFDAQPVGSDMAYWEWSGQQLIFYCQIFGWIGMAFLALGWWRQVNAARVPESPTPSP